MSFFGTIGKRLSEPSTYAGLAAGAALLHGSDAATVLHGAATVAGVIAGATNPITLSLGLLGTLAAIFLPEKGNTP